jgi:GDP-L-fucose synthase
MVNYDGDEPLNVGTGEDIEISALASLISYVVGFNGGIIWDTDKPNGTPRKLLDVSKIKALGWEPKIDLEEGIKSTYEWYKECL